MTAAPEFIPSSNDQLDPIAALVRWWLRGLSTRDPSTFKSIALSDFLATKRGLPRRVRIRLPQPECFEATTRLPRGHRDVHIQALRLRLEDLLPLPPDELATFVRRLPSHEGVAEYKLAAARISRLDELEMLAKKRGARDVVFAPEGSTDIWLRAPKASSQRRRQVLLDAALGLALLVAITTAAQVGAYRLNEEALQMTREYQQMRGAAISGAELARDAKLSEGAIRAGILARLPSQVLNDLAAVNTATPDGAWWISFSWSPERVSLTAVSRDAAGSLSGLAASAATWQIEPSGATSPAGMPGLQQFQVSMRKREDASR